MAAVHAVAAARRVVVVVAAVAAAADGADGFGRSPESNCPPTTGQPRRQQDSTMSKTRTPFLPYAAGRTALALALAITAAGALAAGPAAPPANATAKTTARTAAQAATFATPEAGVEALVAALRGQNAAELRRVLGPDSLRLIDSGDDAADREAWAKFVAEYDSKHRIEMQGEDKAWLSIGAEDWPMPIPLVKQRAGWVFDTDAGDEEIIARRIGRNELDAIQVCRAFIDMERDYAEVDRNGDGILEYAPKLISTPGKHDGLYWPTAPGEPESPAGPRLAQANPGKLAARSEATPFHGYYFRVLTRQGRHASGGALDYSVGGRLIGGVALIAWPSSYLSSGVKTFMCSMGGNVYERDLGPKTDATVAKLAAFDPGPGWSKVE